MSLSLVSLTPAATLGYRYLGLTVTIAVASFRLRQSQTPNQENHQRDHKTSLHRR